MLTFLCEEGMSADSGCTDLAHPPPQTPTWAASPSDTLQGS